MLDKHTLPNEQKTSWLGQQILAAGDKIADLLISKHPKEYEEIAVREAQKDHLRNMLRTLSEKVEAARILLDRMETQLISATDCDFSLTIFSAVKRTGKMLVPVAAEIAPGLCSRAPAPAL